MIRTGPRKKKKDEKKNKAAIDKPIKKTLDKIDENDVEKRLVEFHIGKEEKDNMEEEGEEGKN